MLLLLHAERVASIGNSKISEVQAAYDEAILASGKIGILHLHALGNERAGIFFLEHGESYWSLVYLERAREIYSGWQAEAKVRDMTTKYATLFGSSSNTSHNAPLSMNVHAKTRFGNFIMDRSEVT